MDPLTSFVLSTASSVLASIITDMIQGAGKPKKRIQVEKEVAYIVLNAKRPAVGIPAEVLANRVMEEVEVLSERHPDVVVTLDEFDLAPNVRPRTVLRPKRAKEMSIQTRLAALEKIVAARRAEIEGSAQLTESPSASPGATPPAALVVWRDEKQESVSGGEQRLLRMLSRIEQRRQEDV